MFNTCDKTIITTLSFKISGGGYSRSPLYETLTVVLESFQGEGKSIVYTLTQACHKMSCTPTQLMRPGVGWNASCAVGITSRPAIQTTLVSLEESI